MTEGQQRRWQAGELGVEMEVEVPPPPPAPPVAGGDDGGGDSERERQEIYNALFEDDDDDFNDVSNGSTFFTEFPALPDFSCMSSSSSSSSTRVASHGQPAASTTSSSASSWAVLGQPPDDLHRTATASHLLNYQSDDQAPPGALSSTASMQVGLPPPTQESDDIDLHLNACTDAEECMNVMTNFGYMDLLDAEIWDPASIFGQPQQNNLAVHEPQAQQNNLAVYEAQPQQNNLAVQGAQPQQPQQQQQPEPPPYHGQGQVQAPSDSVAHVGLDDLYFIEGSAELSNMFLEWLRRNKDDINAKEMRNIKLKKHTLEVALRRLGCNKEGKTRLLKLILQWVEHHQLPKINKPFIEQATPGFDLNRNPDPNTPCSPWTPMPQTPVQEFSYVNVCDINPYCGGGGSGNFYQHPSPMDYGQPWNVIPGQMLVPPPPPPHYQFNRCFPDSCGGNFVHHVPHHGPLRHASQPQAQAQARFVNGYPYPVFEKNPRTPAPVVDRLSSLPRLNSTATKEARKKRMARHKRMLHHRHQQNQQNHQAQAVQDMVIREQQKQMHGAVNMENRNSSPAAGDWVFWHPAGAPPSAATGLVPAVVEPPVEIGTMQQQQRSQSVSADRNKSERNLKFLLQKVLKQSDVGNLGRIVLPKREAELHLPELGSRDGITLALEDIGNSSRVFTMRYRYWPNNKSRMYLLENTGEFVRTNELHEGDFIVIYSDAKRTKYMIRGVKVRPQPGTKPEPKKPAAKKKGASKFSPASFEQQHAAM